jgi:hypothetical protein
MSSGEMSKWCLRGVQGLTLLYLFGWMIAMAALATPIANNCRSYEREHGTRSVPGCDDDGTCQWALGRNAVYVCQALSDVAAAGYMPFMGLPMIMIGVAHISSVFDFAKARDIKGLALCCFGILGWAGCLIAPIIALSSNAGNQLGIPAAASAVALASDLIYGAAFTIELLASP